jgi:hypothetical protein
LAHHKQTWKLVKRTQKASLYLLLRQPASLALQFSTVCNYFWLWYYHQGLCLFILWLICLHLLWHSGLQITYHENFFFYDWTTEWQNYGWCVGNCY